VFLTEASVGGAETLIFDQDGIRRFARPDIAGTAWQLWTKYNAHPEARRFLLRIVWLGELKECAEQAAAAAFAEYKDAGRTALFAGRALLSTADDNLKRKYAVHIMARLGMDRPAVVWNAVDALFPQLFSVMDLLAILAAVDVTDRDGGGGLEWEGPKLVERIRSPSEIEQLLTGLLGQLGGPPDEIGHISTPHEQAYFPIIGATALVLSDLQHPPIIAIDAALRLSAYGHDHRARDADEDVTFELRNTAAARRAAFWRAGECFSHCSLLHGQAIESVWEMALSGWSPGLKLEDIGWLLTDGANRSQAREKRLAVDAALNVWREAGSPADLLDQISAVA
jgi:hypothetical protein